MKARTGRPFPYGRQCRRDSSENLVFRLRLGGDVEGTVVDEAGVPVNGYVYLTRKTPQGELTVASGRAGSGYFALRRIPPGEYTLRADAGRQAGERRIVLKVEESVRIEAGKEAKVKLVAKVVPP